MTKRILGVDIGRVIIDGGPKGTDTSFFGDNFLKTPAVQGAFNAIKLLRTQFDDVYLVSKCGDYIQHKSRTWMFWNKFSTITGVKPDHFRFCPTRAGKAPICEELGITHFVDDKLEILGILPDVTTVKFLFRGSEGEIQRQSQHLSKVIQVQSWGEVLKHLLSKSGDAFLDPCSSVR